MYTKINENIVKTQKSALLITTCRSVTINNNNNFLNMNIVSEYLLYFVTGNKTDCLTGSQLDGDFRFWTAVVSTFVSSNDIVL